jgi:tetratricopeptide (TPR) repeat protein
VSDPLRSTWNFDDLDATEERFRESLANEASETRRAELLTQLARVEGLRGRFEEARELLDEAERIGGASEVVRARVLLERGRVQRSGGAPESSFPLFHEAFAVAVTAGACFVAVDSAHMAALAAGDRDGFVAWTGRGIELAEASEDPQVRYWLGPLLNNLGWHYYDGAEYGLALAAFRRALSARERDQSQPQAREVARYAVAKTLRALGRPEKAAPMLERAVRWAEACGEPDGWFHEELAEIYDALGRRDEAREQAERALPLLRRQDTAFEGDSARSRRLRLLAA